MYFLPIITAFETTTHTNTVVYYTRCTHAKVGYIISRTVQIEKTLCILMEALCVKDGVRVSTLIKATTQTLSKTTLAAVDNTQKVVYVVYTRNQIDMWS